MSCECPPSNAGQECLRGVNGTDPLLRPDWVNQSWAPARVKPEYRFLL